MPDPQIDPATGQPVAPPPVDYGQIDLDALFADPTPSAEPTPAPAVPPVQPQAPSVDQLFLDAGTSKYKTKEEAAKGFAEKDSAISKLRQYAIEKTGFDPLTNKEVAKPTPTQEPLSYKKNGKQYVQDLVAALSKGESGAEAYAKVQEKYFTEIASDMFGPYIPVVRDAAKVRAIEEASQGDAQFRPFLASEDYKKTLEAFPDIKFSIEQAEADPRFAERLPSFYKLAHTASLGLKAQEALRNPPPPQPAPGQQAPVARPTTPSGSLTPPPVQTTPVTRQVADELLSSREGRRQIIEQSKTNGVRDFRF